MNLNNVLPSSADIVQGNIGEFVQKEFNTHDLSVKESFANVLIPSTNATILEDRVGGYQYTKVGNEDLELNIRTANFPLLNASQKNLGDDTHSTDKKFMEQRAQGPSRSLKSFTDFKDTNVTYFPDRNLGEIMIKAPRQIETPTSNLQEFEMQKGERTKLSRFNIELTKERAVTGMKHKQNIDTAEQQFGDVKKQQLLSNYQVQPKIILQNENENVHFDGETTTKRYNRLRHINERTTHGAIGVNDVADIPTEHVSNKKTRSERRTYVENDVQTNINVELNHNLGAETRPPKKIKSENLRVLMI